MSTTWVCTKHNLHPTNEEKWEVTDVDCTDYCAKNSAGSIRTLPKSDYRICEPPERWADVTSECYEKEGIIFHKDKAGAVVVVTGKECALHKDYRLKKVQVERCSTEPGVITECHWAFLIEKREDV